MDQTPEILGLSLIATPIILGIVQGLKAANTVSSRWAMPAAIVIGILVCGLVGFTDMIDGYDLMGDWAIAVLSGVTAGLSASGLYSGGQRVVGSA